MADGTINSEELLKAAIEAGQEAEKGHKKAFEALGGKDDEDDEEEDEGEKKPKPAKKMKAGIVGPSDTRMKSAKKSIASLRSQLDALEKSFDAAKEQPQGSVTSDPDIDTDGDHVYGDLPVDEDEEEDNESGEGKVRPRSKANAERGGGKKSMADDPTISKATDTGTEVGDFLKSLVNLLDADLEGLSSVQSASVKALSAMVKSNVGLAAEVVKLSKLARAQGQLLKSLSEQVEQLALEPAAPRRAAAHQGGAPVRKSLGGGQAPQVIERFGTPAPQMTGVTKQQIADRMNNLIMKGDPDISPMDVARYLSDPYGIIRPELRERLGLPSEDA